VPARSVGAMSAIMAVLVLVAAVRVPIDGCPTASARSSGCVTWGQKRGGAWWRTNRSI
jgi:hypothetical protein